MRINNTKISIITTTFNSESEITTLLESVKDQTYQNIEHIFVDSLSTDKTAQIIKKYTSAYNIKLIQKKCNIYEGYNIGIKNATGDLINFIGSDDIYYDKYVLEKIKNNYKSEIDLIYGDINFVGRVNNKITRKYKSGHLSKNKFRFGFMPAHTSMFFSKNCVNDIGFYNGNYKIASDFDFCLRVFNKNIKYIYIKEIITMNKEGGTSNKNIKNIFNSNREILKILKENSIYSNILFIMIKLVFKFCEKTFRSFDLPKNKYLKQ